MNKGVKKSKYGIVKYILILIVVFILSGMVGAFFANALIDNKSDYKENEQKGLLVARDKATVMIMGVDERADDVGRSDTLMIATLDPEKNQAAILSVPRDTRVKISGHGFDKINAAYAYGGRQLTQKTIENLLNTHIDHYIKINIHGFTKIIDALGGIDIDVEKRMYYEDPWDDDGGLVIDLQPGKQHLNGKTAIQYVRYRDGEGDIGRINRQQKFMQAFLAQIISPSVLPKLPDIVNNISSAIQTDMPINEMINLVSDLPTIQKNGLQSEMVPGQPAYIKDVSYWLPDIAKTRKLIAQNMGIELTAEDEKNTKNTIESYTKSLPKGLKMGNTDENKTPAKNEDITVLVINSSGINGAGAEVADILKRKGFKISSVETGNTSSREQTTITANENELNCFYGMPFTCTIMSGGSTGQATVNIGLDYQKQH